MVSSAYREDEAARIYELAKEMYEAIPTPRRPEFLEHLNDIYSFLRAAKRPAEAG